MKYFLAFCLVYCSLIDVSWAGPCEEALKAEKLFETQFFDSACYVEGMCYENIRRFLMQLERENIAIEESQVFIFPKSRMYEVRTDDLSGDRFKLFRGQAGISVIWNIHTVLYMGGKIYDFDYSNNPAPLPLTSYMGFAFGFDPGVTDRPTPAGAIYVVNSRDFINHFYEIENWIGKYLSNHGRAIEPPYIRRQTVGRYFKAR